MMRLVLGILLLQVIVNLPLLARAEDPKGDEDLQAAARQVEMLNKLVGELKKVDDEQQAMRRELGETDEELIRERQRADDLQHELDRLTGKASGEDAVETAATGPAGRQMLRTPARRVNALGLVSREEIAIGEAPNEADVIRLAPLEDSLPVGIGVSEEGGIVTFLRRSTMDTDTKLADLWLKDGQVVWAWRVASPLPLEVPLAELDRLLATAEFQALRGAEVVQRYQIAPVEHRISMRERSIELRLPRLANLPLSVEMVGEPREWMVDTQTPSSLRVASLKVAVTIDWRGDDARLAARTEPGLTAAEAQLAREIAGWERDLAGLRAADPRDEAEITRVAEQIDTTRERHQQLRDAIAAVGGEALNLEIQLVAPNGVVCARVTLVVE